MNPLLLARRSGCRAASHATLVVRLLVAAVAVALVVAAAPHASGVALASLSAEQSALLQRVRDHVGLDDDSLRKFAYTLERRTYDVNFVGKVSSGDIKTYEVVPSPFEPGRSWRRLISVNGVPLTPEQRRRDEEKARQDAEARRRAREAETPPARARRLQREAQDQQKEHERLADIERVFQFTAAPDEVVGGQPLAVFLMTPRTGAETRSDVGRHLERLRGRIWVDRSQAQLVKGEFETTADITVGLGVIGRVGSGSRMVYRRGRASDGTWLPIEMRFEGSGRTLMLIPFHLETWAKYADFRPMSPTATRGGTPHPPQ